MLIKVSDKEYSIVNMKELSIAAVLILRFCCFCCCHFGDCHIDYVPEAGMTVRQ